ncbi:ATP-dependent helicase [Nonomuraea sp. K274]|uniref:ATP-dependent helicase n=1 Tax=Nonomuraea cypriaca TaxID=1187855 RepID=A0A931A9Z9_9ACTN|nr:UvrD-helicase domain-containing protein [Nonomuraea cypriaca]MBF8187359.1 ATP-dependent helicase [Nonomuraea cypriaca]
MFTQPATYTEPPVHAPATPAPVKFEHAPTVEQAAILDAASTGSPLVIEAGAGTGKTSTLKMVAASRPQHRMLYLAYNRAIANDAAASFPPNVDCRTAHSLAFRAVGHQFKHRLNGPRLPAREVARFLQIPAVLDLGAHALTSVKVARIVMDTVARFCHSDDVEVYTTHVPDVPGLSPEAASALRFDVVPFARRAWEDLTSLDGKLKFEHDHYLKIWALTRPVLPYGTVLLDEAQDANPVIARIVEAQQAQQILVGDQAQAIYGWRGAVDAMEDFAGERFQLSQSFRFGQRIADQANEYLELLSAPLRLTGNPAKDSRLDRVDQPNAVLCRTNAGAVGQAMAALGSGLRPALVGGGDDIRNLARACQDLRNGRGTEHPELMAFSSWAEVQEYAEHDAGGADLKTLVKLVDGHGPEAIIRIVDQLVDESNADVVISTAHRAKGREWDTVRLAADWSEPYDAEGRLDRAEAMLTYVAVTRAELVLDCRALPTQAGIHSSAEDGALIPILRAAPDQFYEDALTPGPEPISTDLPAELVGWLTYAKDAADHEKGWKAVKEAAQQKVKDWLVERGLDEATVNGRPAVTYRESAPGGQLNGKSLKKDHPDIYAAYYEPKNASRPFNLTGEWK